MKFKLSNFRKINEGDIIRTEGEMRKLLLHVRAVVNYHTETQLGTCMNIPCVASIITGIPDITSI